MHHMLKRRMYDMDAHPNVSFKAYDGYRNVAHKRLRGRKTVASEIHLAASCKHIAASR
jgi:hypothetical protein